MLKHLFFDLDKTLTKSRSAMDDAHQPLFEQLCSTKDVVVVTGGTAEHIREQLTPRFDGSYDVLAQSGNHAVTKSGETLWYEPLSEAQVCAVHDFVESLKQHFAIPVKDENDLIDNRGAQIGYSVIGYHEDTEKKYAFDPGDTKRVVALRAFPLHMQQMANVGVEVVPAGTTSFNFYAAGRHKGYNIERFMAFREWKAEEAVYVGDALFPGGNDETVIGVIPTHAVSGPDDTFSFIQEVLS